MVRYSPKDIITLAFGVSPLITAYRFFFKTVDSAAHAAAVLLVGTFVQSPIPKIFAEGNRKASRSY